MSKKLSDEEVEKEFQAFLRQSGSSDDLSEQSKHKKKKKKPKVDAWWDDDSDKEDRSTAGKGLTKSGKSFLKSKQPAAESKKSYTEKNEKSSPVETTSKLKTNQEKAKPQSKLEVPPKRSRSRPDISMSKDSLEDISEKSEEHEVEGKRPAVPDLSLETTKDSQTTDVVTDREGDAAARAGIDTLEENADKQRFFQDLEEQGTVDYSKLNQEMSRTDIGLSPSGAARVVGLLNDSETQEQERGQENEPNNKPSCVSADKDSSQAKPSMLSKVSLLDSLDSTLNTTTSPKASIPGEKTKDSIQEEHHNEGDMMKTRTGTGVGTNTSREIEALHEALKEVGMSTDYKPDSEMMSLLTNTGVRDTGNQHTGVSGRDDTADRVMGDSGYNKSRINQGEERGVDDIVREMKAKKQLIEVSASDYKDPPSPGSPSSGSRRLHRQSRLDDDHRGGGFDHSHTDDTEVYQPVTAVALQNKKDRKHDTSETTVSTKAAGNKKSKTKKYSHVHSSGYGRKSPSVSPTRTSSMRTSSKSPTKAKSHTQTWSPADVAKQKIKGSEPLQQNHSAAHHQLVDSQLRYSVESFAQYIKNHFSGVDISEVKVSKEEPSLSAQAPFDKLPDSQKDRIVFKEIEDLQKQLQEEKQHSAKLEENISAMEESFQKRIETLQVEHEHELIKLKQENFVLVAKVSNGTDEPSELRKKLKETTNLTNEKIELFEREIREQEVLLSGYQDENRKLYEEMKNLQKKSKLTEEKMFKENQKLVTEVTNLKSQLEQKEDQLRNKGVITSLAAQQQIAVGNSEVAANVSKMAELEAEVKESKRREENLRREIRVLQQTKDELEQHIDQLVRERESLRKDLETANTAKPQQIQLMEKKHKEEVEQFKKKLKWYAENQELLDKYVKTVREKDETILQLKKRIEEIQTEAGKRLEENKLRNRERAVDAKKIQDYQRQIKEMEKIIKKRYPNSLPALMMTAASAMEMTAKSPTVQVLEKQISNLQNELEGKDEQANTMLRSMEQKYNTIKLQFEERIADLENQLAGFQSDQSAADLNLQSKYMALEEELVCMKDKYQREVTEVAKLTNELNKIKKNQQSSSTNHQTEADLKNQVIQLQGELRDKNHELQVLSVSLDRLRKEKHVYMMRGLGHTASKDVTKPKTKVKGSKKKQVERNEETDKHFTGFVNGESNNREYEPNTFAETHISDILLENEHLKMKVDDLQLALDQQRVELSKALAESEFSLRQTREEYEEQIEKLRAYHQNQIHSLLTEHALQHSTSKLAELQSKCDTQEVMIHHLQEQLAQCSADSEQISVLKIQKTTLETQVEKLQELLREAKKSHTPEMRHFESIQEKVIQLEKRHEQREKELQQMIRNTQLVASTELREEVNKWKRIVDVKNQEIQKFRAELDSILDVLRVLQSQGVVLPVS